MKVERDVLGNFAYGTLMGLVDDDLTTVPVELADIEKAEICLAILRALAEGKKRIVIDVSYPRPKP